MRSASIAWETTVLERGGILAKNGGYILRSGSGERSGERALKAAWDERLGELSKAREAFARARMRGRIGSGEAPFGYRKGPRGKLVEAPRERAALEAIRVWRDEGVSIRGIVARLEEAKHRPRGKRWYVTTVARILKDHTNGKIPF